MGRGESVGVGVGGMSGELGWVSGNFLQSFRKFLRDFPEIPRNRGCVRDLQSDIAQLHNDEIEF